ncbi:MAG: class I SAM-dependent RNA methyltransferase [Chloroflexi bacterium]|nr:class I SAM-dependent RNA methyltransferase [Chloroflexota bacterium]
MINEIFEIDLNADSFGGECIGRQPDGKAVFVPFGICGERVQVEIFEDKHRFSRGRILRVITAAENRITPRCPHFQECGGCHYQHLTYPDQLNLKRKLVVEQLQRTGKVANPPVDPTVPSPLEWNYRNSLQFHLSKNGKLGFQRQAAAGIVEIRECHLPVNAISEVWPTLDLAPDAGIRRVSVRCGSDGEGMVGLESDDTIIPEFEVDFPLSVVFHGGEGDFLLSGEDHSIFLVKGREFRVSARSFFQVNLAQAEAMVDHILKTIDITPESTIVDAYCGVGLFSAFLASKVKNLLGIELSESACNDYASNLDDFDHVSLYMGAVEEVLPNLGKQVDVILLDPPRAGVEPEALKGVIAAAPRQILYISCDPSTLARDAQKLISADYDLVRVTPFDLFPQTYHIETISVFEKKAK